MDYQNLETILSTTSRIPYDNKDIVVLNEYIKLSREKGYEIAIDKNLHGSHEDFQRALREGFIVLTSNELYHRFLLIKINGGKGLFGGQKNSIMFYIGEPSDFMFMQSHMVNKFVLALTSINNLFRDHHKIK